MGLVRHISVARGEQSGVAVLMAQCDRGEGVDERGEGQEKDGGASVEEEAMARWQVSFMRKY
jgi:hypothetical protein